MVVAVGTVIRHCTVEGNQYPVGRPFSFTENCFRFNCECNSDGSWECPSERSEYICQLQPGQTIVRGPSKKMTIIVSDNVRACVARGRDYPLGRPFSFMDGCIKYNCECHSDGSWECPADRAEDTCQHGRDSRPTKENTKTETTRTHTRTVVVAVGTVIRHCTVEGNQYPVGRPFSFTEDCFRFNCECRSDGSWECPSERSEYICRLEPGKRIVRGPSKKMTIIVSDNVRTCVASGNEYPLGRPFSFLDGCIRYNCDCHSDGSWECPADRAEDTCQHGRDRQPTTDPDRERPETTRTHTRTMVVAVGTVIRHCTVEGNQYPVGRPFSFTENCFRFNCECRSDGSWECPSERSEYICRLQPGERIVRGPSKKMTIIVSDNVRACVARGNEYTLGRPFSFLDGCIRYNCECHSDGSWECPADRAEDTCQRDRDRLPTTDPNHTRTGPTITHTRTMVVAVGTEIRHCTVEGSQYAVGRPFSFTENCFQYNCECYSDGSWECPSENSEYICELQPGQQVVRGPSKKMTLIVSDKVRSCVARGNEYMLGRPFSFIDVCIKYHCDCHSDGSWECSADKAEDTCHDKQGSEMTTDKPTTITEKTHTKTVVVAVGTQLSHCTADGKQYAVGRPFSFTQGCFLFNCECHLDGSWECPSESTEYKCQLEPGQKIVRGPSKKMTIVVSNNLRSCIAKGNEYALDQPFTFMDGCIRYSCECHFDGSWECPADKAENTCQQYRANTTEGYNVASGKIDTRTMVVAVGTEITHCTAQGSHYPVGRPFSFTEDCFRFNCECYLNGSWNCPSDRSEFICPLESGQIRGPSKKMFIVMSDNLQACIARGNEYFLGQPFSFTEGCYKYHCECHVDGSWECSANEAEYICNRDVQVTTDDKSPGKKVAIVVSKCKVRGREYARGQRFTYREGCSKHLCECYSNGGWFCSEVKNMCPRKVTEQRNGTERKSHTRSMVIPVGTQLEFCTAQGNKYPLGLLFSFTEKCFQFNCECYQDGSWECPSEKSQYTCPLKPGKRIVRGPSKSMIIVVSNKLDACTVRGQEYPLNRLFSFSDGCYTYQCECYSDGSWDCPTDQAVDRCGHTIEETTVKKFLSKSIVVSVGTAIGSCLVNEIQYTLGSTFTFEDDCFRYKCECHSDASWECPGDLAEYTCNQRMGHATRAATRGFYVITGDNIKSCSANGNEYPLLRPFQFTIGCFRYSCQCGSDGSWECPADKVEDTCQNTSNGQQTIKKTVRRSHTRSIVVAVGTQLGHCLAEENPYKLGLPFSFTEGCFRFNCDCHSDGSWECPSERSEYICQLQPGQKIVRAPSKSLSIVARDNARSCSVKGSEYHLDQPFSFTEGCFIYNCECHTDGSWECPADRAVDRCRRTIEGQPSRGATQGREESRNRTAHTRSMVVSVGTEIRYCISQEMHFTLGQPFSFREGCFEFRCLCHSNGSWDCPAERSEYKCKLEPGQQIVRAPSKSMKIVISDDVRACTANGVDHPLGQPFSFMDGCFIFNCDCHPDGSWECPEDRAVDRCRRTPDGGQRNRDRVEDTIDRESTSWASQNLPIAVKGQVVAPGSSIRSCRWKDKTYSLESTFSFTEDCYLYKCTCNTDGSWECPGHLAAYSCPPQPERKIVRVPSRAVHIIVGANLRTCTVNRVEYDLGRTFVFKEGCFIYNCICHSDGSWECPFHQTVDECRLAGENQTGTNGQKTEGNGGNSGSGGGHRSTGESREQTSHTRSLVVSVGTEIKYCIAHEMRFTLGQPFSFREGCFKFHCQCHLNGSWDCPAERSEYKCKPEPGQQIVRAPSKSMRIVVSDDVRACTANGVDHPLGQPFSFMDGCFIFNCDCHPDGSWECPEDRTVDRCRRTPDEGQRNRGRGGEHPINGQQTSHGQEHTGDHHERSWESTNRPVPPSLGFHPDSRQHLTACTAQGVDYPLGLPFSFTRDCFKYNCECNTDGSWECSGEKSEYVCSENGETQKPSEEHNEFETLSSGKIHRSEATMCMADGKSYPLNQAFSFTVGCYRYNCECRKDGTWECPGHRVENTCRSLEGRNTGKVKRRNIQVVISNNLRTCTVKGVEFPLDHAFSFTDNCVKYNCHCFFDGTWDCPPERIEHACPTSGGIQHRLITSPRLQRSHDSPLRSCVVEGVEYASGSSFNFKAFCYRFNCRCFSDGSWECPSSKSEFICRDVPIYQYTTNRTTGEQLSSQGIVISPRSTPKYCSAYGLYHKLNQSFIVTDRCFRLRCYCHSDGSWECPSRQAIYFCPTNSRHAHRAASRSLYVTVSSRPTMCQVKGNQYNLGQPFIYMDGCFKYHCICNIDGSWACPTKRTQDTCPANSTEQSRMQRASAEHGFPTRQQRVWFCMVKGTRYPIGRPFTYTEGCIRYTCDCKSGGSWNCPAHKSQNICQGQGRREHITHKEDCVHCTVKDRTYRKLSRFHYLEGCIERHCTCNCDGTPDCPVQDAISRCHGCIDCMVDGVLQKGHSHFKRTKDCVTVDCSCYCNGTFECFDERKTLLPCAENTPIGGHTGDMTPTPPTPITLSGTMPTLIFTDRFLPPGITRRRLQPTVPPTVASVTRAVPIGGDGLTGPGKLSVAVQHKSIGNITNIDFKPNITLQGGPSVHTTNRSQHSENKRILHTDVRVVNAARTHVNHTESITQLPSRLGSGAKDPDQKECKGCNVYTKYHKGNTTFKYIEGCYEYLCTCYCDSSWTCPDDQTVNTCETQVARCNSCTVDGRSYRGNTTFIYKVDNCIERSCACNCDGSFSCPSNETVNVCDMEPQCTKCSVRDQLFDPNTDFTLQQGCLRYRCKCNCDGGWNCPADATEDICQISPLPIPGTGCIKCNARGVIAEPNTNFELQQGCIKYKCFCKCDGGWSCPGDAAVNTCNTDAETGCQFCDVRGEKKKGHSRFELKDGCWNYQCICNCDGSWDCPKETAVYSCETKPRCYKCNARGSVHEPNTRFSLQEECFKYQCTCNCDGSWNCPGETAVDTCNTDPETGCRYCDVRGQREKGNTRFELQEGCIKYQCVCECSGRWNCPTERSINTCVTQTQTPTRCHNCIVHDKSFPGNSYFTHEENCFRYQCTCHCDGGWNCPASTAVYICDRTTPAPACRHCIAKGQYFAGNSDFKLEEGCYRYSCRCKCDGGWECPAHSAVNICDRTLADCNECNVDGRMIPGNSSFMQTSECFKYDCTCKCDGNWHCPADKAIDICNTPAVGCQQCNIKGVLYQGNSNFTHEENCFRYQCLCKCDGSWDCPPETAVDSCHTSNRSLTGSGCLKCQVDGKMYHGNTKFQRDENCFRYQCKCQCNGTWACSPETAFDICNKQQSKNTCKKCEIGDSSYAANTNFYHVDNCRKILCKCNCDGNYNCLEDNVIDICNGTNGECTKCMVQGKSYLGNSDFIYQYGCYSYHCRCNCDGKATCPEEKAVDVCAAGILDQKLTQKCQVCKVHGRLYKGNTKFVLQRGCFSYQCTCSCDGRWHCPSESAKDSCSTPATVTIEPTNNAKCKRCKVKHQIFKGNTVFFQNNGCYRYRCKCICDGSWECPTEEAVDICRGLEGRLPISDRQCVNCKVRGQLYKGGEDFDLLEACFKFRCQCDCNGKWKCPSQQPENVCIYETPTTKPCQECLVKNKNYTGNSWFTYEQGCRRLQCQCRCSGTWHCPTHLTSNVCNINKDVRSDGVCKKCVVRGISYAGDSYFSFDRGCLRFRCSCNCDGSWNCLAGRAVNICQGTAPVKKCKKCHVGKKVISGNETFEYVFGCKKYQCNCFCDGKFFCPGDKTQEICGRQKKNSTEISTRQSNRNPTPTPSRSCDDCTIDGKTFPGNSNFRYTLNCFMYECDCGCDGTWSCPPERSVNICADKSQTDCGHCMVDGRRYDGDIQFKRKHNCFEYTCTCHCNGTWHCPTENAQYVCDDDDDTAHCKDCVVDGHLYRGSTDVNITEGCQQHQCKCSCEGSWSCRTISDTCRHDLQLGTGCTTCYVKEKFYNANSWFSTVEGCTEFRCRCNCDGTSTCHERLVRNICNNGTIPQTTGTANADSANDDKGQGCTVRGQTYYTKHFTYTDQCILYACTCTNGSYNCPPEVSTTIC